jgi:hypothetical protein
VPVISPITGPIYAEWGSIAPYYITRIEGKKPVNYNWTVSHDTILSGQGTDSVSVQWEHQGLNNLTVVASNECGSDTSTAIIYVIIGGINDNSLANSLNVPVYPIPVKDVLYMKLPSGYDRFEVTLADVYGRQKFSSTMFSGLNTIDLSGQAEGMYFLEIKASDKVVIKKIVLTRQGH